MNYHHIEAEKVLNELESSVDGLTSSEAENRIKKYGANKIMAAKKISPISIFFNQFKNMLVLLLLLAAIVSFVLSFFDPEKSEIADAILIFIIVIANALFGFFQEYKAERTIEALTKMSAPHAYVIRKGLGQVKVEAKDIVPGDILVLREGDKVAADARLIESFSLYSDESSLTGESVPSEKSAPLLEENIPLAERANMVYMSCSITRGKGKAVVTATASNTEIGKIAKEISEVPEKRTQFMIELEDIGQKVSYITLVILVIIFAAHLYRGETDYIIIFITAIAIGVAAIPEGLPAVVTLALSIATNRMLKQNALMRRLSTVQDLGSVDAICTDKTGTLTENLMTVTRIYGNDLLLDLSGKGHDLEGKFFIENKEVPTKDLQQNLEPLFQCALLCNDSYKENGFKGDPTDIAVLIPSYKVGLDVEKTQLYHPRVDEIPFSSDRKMMSTIHLKKKDIENTDQKNADNKDKIMFSKGAIEILIKKCSHIYLNGEIRELNESDLAKILSQNKEMAQSALRVLAFAYKHNPKSNKESEEQNLVFLGLMGMMDPPRQGVREAIQSCRDAGIRVVMITGDNKYTAEAIGKDLGFTSSAIGGDELDKLSEDELEKTVEEIDIYARASPKHKVTILKSLQKNHVVCMSGDGVNDAPAIKNADVGIAMGIRGTEVTKQASDIIILDDNFVTIKNAISEGRGTFDNIRKFVIYLLGANIAEVLIVFICTLFGIGISPKIAIQLLWINLLTDGLPALALGVDPPALNIMKRPPRKKHKRIIGNHSIKILLAIGILTSIFVMINYLSTLEKDPDQAHTVMFTNFVFLEMITVYLVRWRFGTNILSNKYLHLSVLGSILLQLILLYSPLSSFFGVVTLTTESWIQIALTTFAYTIVLICAIKLIDLKRKYPKNT